MFDIGSSELLLIVIIAVVVIGPKDLPRALYKVGQVIGKARGMARHFRTGIDAMVREVEMEEPLGRHGRLFVRFRRVSAAFRCPIGSGRHFSARACRRRAALHRGATGYG